MARRILFAEDNPEDRVPVAKYLRAKGWDVTEVFDPSQAIESLKENEDTPFDVIILDIVMPENNPRGGEDVLRFLVEQDRQHRRVTPVILATAWGYNGPAQGAKAVHPAAVKCVLTKTYSLRELTDVLTEISLAPKSPAQNSALLGSTAEKPDSMAADTIIADTTAVFMHKLLNGYNDIVAIVRTIEDRLKALSANERTTLADLPIRLEKALESARYLVQRFRNVLGRHPGILKPMNIHRILADVDQHFSSELRPKVRLDLTQEDCTVLGDYELLWHLFENLISNALDAIQGHSGEQVKISTAVDNEHRTVRVAVIDNGTGIKADDLPKIFGLNYSTKPKGLGIGLYLVRRAAQIHGGQVECQSEWGKGSAFTVSLPLTPAPQQDTT